MRPLEVVRSTVALAATVALSCALAACDTDDAVDGAQQALGDAADEAISSQLADQLVERTALSQAEADCVSTELIDELGTAVVIDLLIDTGGDLSQASDAERQQVQTAARAAGEACGVDAGDVYSG